MERDQVAMAQPCRRASIIDEPADAQRILGQIPWEDLDRPRGLEHGVLGQIELAGADLSEAAQDLRRAHVRADHLVRLASAKVSVVTQPHAHWSRPSERGYTIW